MTQSKPETRLLGQILLDNKCLVAADLEKALQFQAEFGGLLGGILTRLGLCSEAVLLPHLAAQLGVEYVPEAPIPEPEVVSAALDATRFSPDWFAYRRLIPWLDEAEKLHVASNHPGTPLVCEVFSARGYSVCWHLLSELTENVWLDLLENRSVATEIGAARLRERAEEAPVVSLVNNILAQAVELEASDIHLEPEEGVLRVRYRIDGVLVDRMRTAGTRVEAVISRLKLMADLDIAERRLPQDGRISLQAAGIALDVRISTLPDTGGESVVLRLLPKDQRRLNLDLLGLPTDVYARMSLVTHQPHGLILVTGPTGSGKSTTLYALLSGLNTGQRKIITVEDPVENTMQGVVQVQANADIGLDFARTLRAILRQDPDIIMIGEIRDRETARIAVQSSLTGHTVLSTLHTNDAISAFGRMIDIGVEAFLLASAVRGVLAQRLVRRLCPHCRASVAPLDGLQRLFADLRRRFPDLLKPEPHFYRSVGCDRCLHTGYSGRSGIYEWVEVTAGMAQEIAKEASESTLLTQVSADFRTMREDGMIKCWNGETSVEEVFRVTGEMEVAEDATDQAAQDHVADDEAINNMNIPGTVDSGS